MIVHDVSPDHLRPKLYVKRRPVHHMAFKGRHVTQKNTLMIHHDRHVLYYFNSYIFNDRRSQDHLRPKLYVKRRPSIRHVTFNVYRVTIVRPGTTSRDHLRPQPTLDHPKPGSLLLSWLCISPRILGHGLK